MSIMDYINEQDWDAAIAECTARIKNCTRKNKPVPYYIYMLRGYAYCFIPTEGENYKNAIEDLSKAITLVSSVNRKAKCQLKRAYAYWLSGRYDGAMADCNKAIDAIKMKKSPYISFACELLGNIYSAINDPAEAVEHYKEALFLNPCSPSLLDNYRKARERLNRSR
jgi:tetratricopeptide (TPR) repeat protein